MTTKNKTVKLIFGISIVWIIILISFYNSQMKEMERTEKYYEIRNRMLINDLNFYRDLYQDKSKKGFIVFVVENYTETGNFTIHTRKDNSFKTEYIDLGSNKTEWLICDSELYEEPECYTLK